MSDLIKLYDENGERVGTYCIETGRAQIGNSFFVTERACHLIRNEWGTPLTDQYFTYDCSECGYTVKKISKFATYTPPNYCGHCGCKINH